MDRALSRFFDSKGNGQRTNIISKSTQKYLLSLKIVLNLQKWDPDGITKCNSGGFFSEKLLSSSQGSEGTDIFEKKAEPYLRLVLKSRVELPQTDMAKMNGHSTAIPIVGQLCCRVLPAPSGEIVDKAEGRTDPLRGGPAQPGADLVGRKLVGRQVAGIVVGQAKEVPG
ncbi:MAG: hypothetical protein OXU26_11460, partial [Acidobacteriota bacterium]|nr:hypothetical protein [Acidobacteriota bacterium]